MSKSVKNYPANRKLLKISDISVYGVDPRYGGFVFGYGIVAVRYGRRGFGVRQI